MSESSKMEPLPLSFAVLLGYLYQAIEPIADPRQSSNATRYTLSDVIVGAFSVFFTGVLSAMFPLSRESGRVNRT